jgi:hypothetical protein
MIKRKSWNNSENVPIKKSYVCTESKTICACISCFALQAAAAGIKQTAETHLITPMKIVSLVKSFKTHRCTLDFDKGFIKAAITVFDE